MPYFTEAFLSSIPNELWPGVRRICDAWGETPDNDFDIYLEGYALLKEFTAAHGLPIADIDTTKQVGLVRTQISDLFRHLGDRATREVNTLTLESSRSRFRNHFGSAVVFELSDGDVSRIQELIDLLRKEISQCETLTQSHRQRVLAKLEKLQGEIHKKESDFDKYYGVAVEVFALAKKAGEAALPWAKCVREILQIVWNSQSRALGLPSTTPMEFLPNSEKRDT